MNATKNRTFAEVTGQLSADGGGDPFTIVKSKKKRPEKSKKPAIVGSFTASESKLSAARPVVHKAIFHVDNASEGCQPNDIIDHLKSLDIPVVSCFDCKSWRKQGSLENTSRAFRLCVEKEIVSKILDKEIWPRGIMVRPWKFKPADAKKSFVDMESAENSEQQPPCSSLAVDLTDKTDLSKNGV